MTSSAVENKKRPLCSDERAFPWYHRCFRALRTRRLSRNNGRIPSMAEACAFTTLAPGRRSTDAYLACILNPWCTLPVGGWAAYSSRSKPI